MAEYREEANLPYIQGLEVGDRVVTKPRVVTKTDLELYASATGDTHPMFLSEQYAQSLGWRTQIVPGLLSLSIAVGLMIQSGFIAEVVAFMGAREINFHLPVYPYDTIRAEGEVLSKKQIKDGRWICSYKWLIRNQRDEAVAEGEHT